MSKVLEHLLFNHMESCWYTSDNQFGFKAKHSTDQCIYVLKEVIDFTDLTTLHNVYKLDGCFDRVNHWTLFKNYIVVFLIS